MTIIAEIYFAVQGGANLEDVIPLGSDITTWRRILDNYDPNRKAKKTKRNRASGSRRQSKRSSYARMQAALGWATLELVERVNSDKADMEAPL